MKLHKALSNEKRYKISLLLFNHTSLTVTEIQNIINIGEKEPLAQSALSQHLRIMRELGTVKTEKKAQKVYYSLTVKAFNFMTAEARLSVLEGIFNDEILYRATKILNETCEQVYNNDDVGGDDSYEAYSVSDQHSAIMEAHEELQGDLDEIITVDDKGNNLKKLNSFLDRLVCLR